MRGNIEFRELIEEKKIKDWPRSRLMANQKIVKAVFLDRDGVLNEAIKRAGFDLPTPPLCLRELKIFPWVPEALALLQNMGFLRIMVTNQPDVKKGLVSERKWRAIQTRVEKLGFDDVFICPHLREDNCPCKKPRPGMLLKAVQKWDLDISRCYMIGDLWTDTGAARAAGCVSILVRADYNIGVKSDYIVQNLLGAVHLIQQIEKRRK